SREAWAERAKALRRQVLVANGLWPLPTKTPLNAVIHGRVEHEDYTVEKVYFESFPGHYVSGSLYRPKGKLRGDQIPGILSPHGHWSEGRFHDHGDKDLKKELDSGAERFDSGRHPLQARCVQLARMGCVVFHYDMVGYADSVQLDHRKSTMSAQGLFSVDAELRQQNMMGIQTYNSIRALDFLETLPEVDDDRIGVTGASGGGTQTFVLGAVDDRPDLLFPAVMVGTAMQGGCVCENANYLRVGAGNVDLAALALPRPLGLTGADDWTVEIETKGKPDLEVLYTMVAVPERFAVFANLQFGHNYNVVSREAMYGFVNKHFQLGHVEPIRERDFTPLTRIEMSVWTEEHPAPKSVGAVHEEGLLRWWAEDSDAQLSSLALRMPNDAGAARSFREMVGGAWKTILGRTLEDVGPIEFTLSTKVKGTAMTGLLTVAAREEQVPALFLHPSEDWNGEVVLMINAEKGKQAILGADAEAFVAAGYSVMSIDVLHTGESAKDGRGQGKVPLDDGRSAAVSAFTFGYNHPLFVQRVHDVLTAIAFIVENPQWDAKKLHLVGLDGGGSLLALAARFQCGEESKMGKTALLEQKRFEEVSQIDDPWFVPGAVKYGDTSGLVALCAPAPVLVSKSVMSPAAEAYLAIDAKEMLDVRDKPNLKGVIAWLAK
ncbi:MAG: cephalosporin-C deacetylase-like acetyl esterase, partial [Verrucomicrobiales bacterium]